MNLLIKPLVVLQMTQSLDILKVPWDERGVFVRRQLRDRPKDFV